MTGPIVSNWVSPSPQSFVVREKVRSWSQNDFTVKDTAGNLLVKASGKALSFGDDITLNDARSGAPLVQLRQDKMHFHQHFFLKRTDGSIVATIRKKAFSFKDDIRVYAGRADFSMGMNTDAPLLMQMKGNWLGRNFEFLDPMGRVLAKSHEVRMNMAGVFFGQDEYELDISPNVDAVFILGCLMIMDCMQENSRR